MPEKKDNKKNQVKKEKAGEIREIIPPLDFSSLILPFYTQALIKLGLAKDPFTNKEQENLSLAKRLIDLLDLLKERTEGKLKPEEEKFLSACLQQLKMAYMEKTNIIKL
jgi:hypothetical protein